MSAKMMYRLKFKNGASTPWNYSRAYVLELMKALGGKLEMKVNDSPIKKQ